MNTPENVIDATEMDYGISRRSFLKYSIGSIFLSYSGLNFAAAFQSVAQHLIDSDVLTTVDRMLSFPMPEFVEKPNSGKGLSRTELHRVDQYDKYGYGTYTYGA